MMKIRHKHDIDAAIAADFGMDVKEVRDITHAFLEYICESLADMELVNLPGFGRMNISSMSGKFTVRTGAKDKSGKRNKRVVNVRKFRVNFAKGSRLNHLLLEKYGPGTEEKL